MHNLGCIFIRVQIIRTVQVVDAMTSIARENVAYILRVLQIPPHLAEVAGDWKVEILPCV